MATDFEFEVVVDAHTRRKAESVLYECHSRVAELERMMTEYSEGSPIYRLNQSESGQWIKFPSELVPLLKLSQDLCARSGGYFNPFAKSEGAIGFADLEIRFDDLSFRRSGAGVRLGFGAIGKGYALDFVRTELEREGFSDYRLNCGGSSWIFGGFGPNGEAWSLAWAWGRDAEGDLRGHRYRLPAGAPVAVGVSGVLEQGNHFRFEGRAISAGLESAIYIGRSAAEADALSTALFVGASLVGESILTRLEDGIRKPSLAYVDLEGMMSYNRTFETKFLHEGRIR